MFNATITGRLGSDPEMRYTDGGTPVVNVSIAHNWLHRDERLVKWIRCSIWGELAEKAMTALHKGDLVKVWVPSRSGPGHDRTVQAWKR